MAQYDEGLQITIQEFASNSGSKEYDSRLGFDRGNYLADKLIEYEVPTGQIIKVALRELMSDPIKAGNDDSDTDRFINIEFSKFPPDANSEKCCGQE